MVNPQVQLNPPQTDVVSSGILDCGFSAVLQMPTGSGKTWLAEQAMEIVLSRGCRAVYLTPLRALATELMGRWTGRFANYRVGVFTGDYGNGAKSYPVPFIDARLLVMTPERLDACTRAWRSHWQWITEVDLVVADEFHLLGERRRGARLEGALMRFQSLNPFARILALSATLGNRCELADWLEGVDYFSQWRPIPIQWRFVRYKQASDKPALLESEVSRNIKGGGKSLVFVQSRRRAEQLSQNLRAAGVRALHHHAGLSQEQRSKTENAFRGSEIDVLVATATLEMGLNLPVRQVVLYDVQSFDGIDFEPLSVNSVWQRIGRAGRPGLDSEGEGVLFAPTWDRNVQKYERGNFEPIRSALADRRALAEQIVTAVSTGLARSEKQIDRVFSRSLAARQGILPNLGMVIAEMIKSGMLEEIQQQEDPHTRCLLRATTLGRIAVRHMLLPSTVLLLHRILIDQGTVTFLDLLVAACCTDDCEILIPVDFEDLDILGSALSAEPSMFLRRSCPNLCELLGIRGKRLLAALNTALIARSWTRLGDAQKVADANDCYPFEVQRLCESIARILMAAVAIADAQQDAGSEEATPIEINTAERAEVLHKMMQAGLDESAVTLTRISGIGPKTARRMTGCKIRDIEDLAAASIEEVTTIGAVSSRRAEVWISEASTLIKTRSAFTYKEDTSTVRIRSIGWDDGIDPYRLRRSLDLVVVPQYDKSFVVSGGLEPHRICHHECGMTCDCPDFLKGNLCKHILAVQLFSRDAATHKLVERLSAVEMGDDLDLFGLWIDSGRPAAERRVS
jgi:helicase